ncbi:MAG: hypothetical protein MUC87_16130 [Bacteroidia bacterium]|jgi:hypothetical protein|nr:hypothetical protein [Bacteroidia bacterium]
MNNVLRFWLAMLLCCSAFAPVQAQIYIGYRAGMYRAPEIPPQVYAAKFNAGWKFRTAGNIILFDAASGLYTIDNNLEWGNIPHGINFGFAAIGSDKLGIQLGFFQFSQRSSGKRTNIATGVEETFSLKSKNGGITFNVVVNTGKFRPFIGTDLGLFRILYSFKNDQYDLKKQKLGAEGGDRSLTARFNFGSFIQLVSFNNMAFMLVPQFQFGIQGFEEIKRQPYENHVFDHSNFSIGLYLTYGKN